LDENGNPAWRVEPNIPRVAKGIKNRASRVKVLGNAVVPQIAEWLAKRILEFET
jgi:site-specific DNA-cytosine methylase